MKIEHEIKLAIEEADAAKIASLPLVKAAIQGRRRTERQISVYFDTPDRLLLQRKVALRVRHIGKRRLQTLKAGGELKSSLSARPEWEHWIRGDRPDLARLDDPALHDILAEVRATPAALRPVFRTDIRRTIWRLAHDGAQIEMALDLGDILAARRRAKVAEIELELKSGEIEGLIDFALALHKELAFRLEPRSKSSRGYELASGLQSSGQKAGVVDLNAEMSVLDAFRQVIVSCLYHLEANEAAALAGKDAEGVHQMRVALRRMRSALAVFSPALPESLLEGWRDELRWIAQELGPAREWDVFILETITPLLQQMPQDASLTLLRKLAGELRKDGYARARELILSGRYTDSKLRLTRLLLIDDWRSELGAEALDILQGPLLELARRLLKTRHRKLLKLGNAHQEFSDEELHELRIRAKKMRYGADFFRRLFPKKATKKYLARLSAMQESLGAINDATVGRQRLDEAVERGSAKEMDVEQLARADGLVSGWLAARRKAEQNRFAELWSDFEDRKPFW